MKKACLSAGSVEKASLFESYIYSSVYNIYNCSYIIKIHFIGHDF